MKGNILEAVIGAIVLVVAVIFVCFAYRTSGEKINDGYVLVARFDDIGGITVGSDVKLNGIKIGVVGNVKIDENYQARVELLIKWDVQLPNDSSAAITSDGLMGNKFISIVAGFPESEKYKAGDEIGFTRSSVDFVGLIDKFVANTGGRESKEAGKE
ncbi:MAG: outer membrane lipid asymmetry maintenance protein MlaD [Holosporales bacterium]|jgi:phospholipid/cholesterol/gamma-HCH transport system substrate-binding protein|nr:outer membrane lipid asymmetry maintenance protein MlaD [Holosporales bacterium]